MTAGRRGEVAWTRVCAEEGQRSRQISFLPKVLALFYLYLKRVLSECFTTR